MSELEELYNDLIMEHSMASHNKKDMEHPTACLLGNNPNCGDEIKLEIKLENGIIKDACFTGHGCAISQSSTSMMIDLLKEKSISDAKNLINLFVKMIKREKLSSKEKKLLGECAIFENVSNMPARVKCALLSWHTMETLLDKN